MHKLFMEIKSVGFDLDDTLYPSSPEIDDRIMTEIAQKILHKKPELINLERAKCFYGEERRKIGSGTQVLEDIGYENSKEIMLKCLTEANILDLLKKDINTVNLFERINDKYETFLITASPSDLAIQKLNKIGINFSLFNNLIFGDTSNSGKKVDGSIFRFFLNKSKYSSSEHLYIGDSLKADIIPSKREGMRAIAIGKKMSKADFSIEKICELEKLLL